MTMHGSCDCNNIEIMWHVVGCSFVPRACQCEYCVERSAAYVSESSAKIEVTIGNEDLHRVVLHGSKSAMFHECTNCIQVIFVTSEIDGELYGALNANHLDDKENFPDSTEANFSYQTAEEKRERWRQNWCHPVLIIKRYL